MLGTINIWLLIGLIFSIVYLLWRNSLLEKSLNEVYNHQFLIMASLEQSLGANLEEYDVKLSQLDNKVEYLYEQETSRLSKTDS